MPSAGMDKWIHGISPTDRTSDVALRTLRTRLAAVQRYLPLAAENTEEDVNGVHELRVATRRATAALNLYAELLPRHRTARMVKCLKRIRKAAGKVREYDVLCRQLAQSQSNKEAGEFQEKVRSQRRESLGSIQAVHSRLKKHSRFDRMIIKLLRRIHPRSKSTGKAKDPRFDKWALSRLEHSVSRFFRKAPTGEATAGDLHRFRVRTKEFRYQMEMLAGAFPASFVKELYPVIENLQQLLGEVSDQTAVLALLHQSISAADDTVEIAFLRRLMHNEQERLDQSYRSFHDWWTQERREEYQARLVEFIAEHHDKTRHKTVSTQPPATLRLALVVGKKVRAGSRFVEIDIPLDDHSQLG